ncbi:hypothetical protein L2E82_16920 [Cichorium intybus]|uniref:Uncharacterized protein n=1 Tax=Cichorium intybus TaxID=13427 RepID=A0ACB9F6V8_CICIN|nr:hypothetical protein L2E82_16920 [Cichorium intybus]
MEGPLWTLSLVNPLHPMACKASVAITLHRNPNASPWLDQSSLIGDSLSLETLSCIQTLIEDDGDRDIHAKYLGGLYVVIKFKDSGRRRGLPDAPCRCTHGVSVLPMVTTRFDGEMIFSLVTRRSIISNGKSNSLTMQSGVDPPQGLALSILRSMRKVSIPPLARVSAAAPPAGPPPTTATRRFRPMIVGTGLGGDNVKTAVVELVWYKVLGWSYDRVVVVFFHRICVEVDERLECN